MKKLIMYVAFAVATVGGSVMAQKQNITLEDIWTKRTFAPQGIGSIRSMSDGEHYLTMSRTGIAKYSYATGEKVADICVFEGPAGRLKARPLPPMESYAMSDDEKKILLSSGFEPIYRHSGVSDYWLYDIEQATFTKLSNEGKQRLTALSPDGTKIAFVRDNNLYWMDLSTMEEHAITTDGKPNAIIYGTTDWVYEEEFAITRGFQWSPDSKQIAFMRFDESKVREYNMQMWGGLYPDDYRYKYPKAGEDNSLVEMRIYKLEGGKTQRVKLGENDYAVATKTSEWEYVPRFQWADANTLAIMRMNRLQNHVQILTIGTDKESSVPDKVVYEENDNAYVEVPDTWSFITVGKGKKAALKMLITSERDGYRHIYICDMDGKMSQVTSGDYEVDEICAVDIAQQRIYYTSREHGSTTKSLFMIGFDGKEKKCLNHTIENFVKIYDIVGSQMTVNSNMVVGTYNASFSKGCKYYICIYSNANMPPAYTLHDANGKMLKVLESNRELQHKMTQYNTQRKEFGNVPAADGTPLNYYIIRPDDFDSTKAYPLFFYVYGGPGNQQVSDSYGYSDYYWFHMLAQEGYVVVCFDGRGTGCRGAKFKKQTYRDLGRMECEDAIAAARHFAAKPWIDENRIGIFGWSFGGYLSTLSILKGNDVFKSAIAVAPVMTWRYYDNIYTERFLGLPNDNAKGYDENSPLNFAEQLKGKYLLVHGTGDDNVHFQNSAEMVERLENAGKQFEFRIYPNKNHSIYDATGRTRLNLYQLMTDFIERNL